jgi:hypothetical protein
MDVDTLGDYKNLLRSVNNSWLKSRACKSSCWLD